MATLDWSTGLRLAAPRLAVGGVLLGSPWAFAGFMVAWPSSCPPTILVASAWLSLATALEYRVATRELSRSAESSP
jgi:hypothetical protein